MNDTAATTDLLAVTLAQTLAQEHVADIVETLNDQDDATIAHVLAELPFERAVEVLDQPELTAAADAVALLPDQRAGALLSAMSADRAADVFQEFDEEVRQRLSGRIDRQTRSDLKKLLAYPEHSAGSIMPTG